MKHEMKKFDGKKYTLVGRHTKKSDAEKEAKALRKDGNHARVVKVSHETHPYLVWFRGSWEG